MNKSNLKRTVTRSCSNSHCQGYSTKDIGNNVRILQLNIEGISKAKTEYLQRLTTENNTDIILLQEMHTANEEQLLSRGRLQGYTLAAALHHRQYGCATYIRENIRNWAVVHTSDVDDISIIAVRINELTVVNVYKPPSRSWPENMFPNIVSHPTVLMGDFNCHHTDWGYQSENLEGEKLVEWMDVTNLQLIFDAKERGTFRSARWNRDYNPDLCLVTRDGSGRSQPISRTVAGDFPHSQHRPVMATIGHTLTVIHSIPKPRWNFQKADWATYKTILDNEIETLDPLPTNYKKIVDLILATAKKTIPRGFRKAYVPGWNEECERLYNEFLNT